MAQFEDEVARWELQIADLERRIDEQKNRIACEKVGSVRSRCFA